MKGYRTPSWFRTKVRIKEKETKVRSRKGEIRGSKKGKQTSESIIKDRK